MVKSIVRRVDVRHDGRYCPRAFHWNDGWVSISHVLEIWKDTGTWWDGEPEKTFYRVESGAGNLYELYMDNTTRKWFLYRIYD